MVKKLEPRWALLIYLVIMAQIKNDNISQILEAKVR